MSKCGTDAVVRLTIIHSPLSLIVQRNIKATAPVWSENREIKLF
jgi:hypothetical protein